VLTKSKQKAQDAEISDPKELEQQKDRIAKLIQLQNILERDKFEGLNRKA
jgi:inositol-hexakisphosphate/diphosphoinositol-pentakisphosphate 1-kinase